MGALEGPRLSGTIAPIPESLKPPHGDDGSLRWWQLIHTMPATTPCALAPNRARFRPKGSGSCVIEFATETIRGAGDAATTLHRRGVCHLRDAVRARDVARPDGGAEAEGAVVGLPAMQPSVSTPVVLTGDADPT